jgi:3-oxoacyl-(acyl-carrier-protein) synthase
MSSDDILDAIIAGRSANRADYAMGHVGWSCRIAAEIADFNPRALVDDRKLHKLIRRTDLLGLYAAGRAIERSGIIAHRNALEARRGAIQRPHRRLRRIGRRQLREPVRLFSAVCRDSRRVAGVRRELATL